MKEMFLQMLLLQLIVIIVLTITFFYLIKIRRYLEFEKRISQYAISGINSKDYSIGDRFIYQLNKILKKLSKSLAKRRYFKNKAKKYYKFLTSKEIGSNFNEYYIISIKMFLSFIMGVVYLISATINYEFNILLFIIFLIGGYYLYDVILNIKFIKRRKAIEEDLLNSIIIMNNSFKAGYNILQAIDTVIKDLHGPIKDEFIKIRYDLNYGLDLVNVFENFYKRIQIKDAQYITSSLSLLNLTGGNLSAIFNGIESAFTNKKRLKDELNALTGSSYLVYRILLAMPFVLIILIILVNPAYFNPLFSSLLGIVIILLVVLLLILYIYTIKKILRIDV